MNLLSKIRSRFHPLWKIRRTPWLFSIFKRLDFAVWMRSSSLGVPMRVLWFRDMSWLFDSIPKEPELNRLMEQLCETFQPKVFWDVGANIGWFTWLVNSRTELQEAVLFEPLPQNAKLLRQTINRSGYNHIKLIEAAVADHSGQVSFLADEQSGATSQITEIFATSGETSIAHTYGISKEIMVRTTTMDEELANGAAVPDLIKMDIEEAEVLALKGAENLLSLGKPLIAFECHRTEAIEMLRARNYSVYRVDDHNNYLAVPPKMMEQAKRITSTLEKIENGPFR